MRERLSRVMTRVIAAIVSGALLSAAAPTQWSSNLPIAANGLCASTVFEGDPSGVPTYRIPSIVRLASGRLIALAERRDSRTLDSGDFDIVYRTSDDEGCSWSETTVLADVDGRLSNPAPIIDQVTGALIVMMSLTDSRGIHLVSTRSEDDDDTWSPLVQISNTDQIDGWRGGLVSPGHGLQLQQKEYAGRLVFLAGTSGTGQSAYLSDDHGETWRRGFTLPTGVPDRRYVEGALAELPDGRIWATFRNHASTVAGQTRGYAVSSDGAKTLDGDGVAPQPSAPGIVSVYASTLVPQGAYRIQHLMAAPSTYDPEHPDRRLDVGVYASMDGGRTWNAPVRMASMGTPGGYTDLVQLSSGRLGVLYETGVQDWRERIAFRQFWLSDLLPTPAWCPVEPSG